MIKIICLGKIKDYYVTQGINDYVKRISKYHKIEIIECKDNDNILIEEKEIMKYYDSKNYNVALCIEGNQISSIDFANNINNNLMKYGNICFFIGSSNGLSEYIKDKCNIKMSFGKVTMPHGLFRLILTEQIYRAFKIFNNETYHK